MGSHELGRARGDETATPAPPALDAATSGPPGSSTGGPSVWAPDPGTAPQVNQFGIPVDTPGATQPAAFLRQDGPTRYADPTASFSRAAPVRRAPARVSGTNAIRMVVSGIALVLALVRLVHGGANAVNALDGATAAAPVFAQGQCVRVSLDTTSGSTTALADIRDVPCSRDDAHVILRTGSMKGRAQDEASVAAAVRKAAPTLVAQGDVYWSTTQWILVATATTSQQDAG